MLRRAGLASVVVLSWSLVGCPAPPVGEIDSGASADGGRGDGGDARDGGLDAGRDAALPIDVGLDAPTEDAPAPDGSVDDASVHDAGTDSGVVPPPDTSIVTGPASRTASTSASFTFSSDGAGATFVCSLDGAAYAPCASPHALTGLGEGAHELRVAAIAADGQSDPTPAIYAWTIDVTGPDVLIGSGPASPFQSGHADFTVQSTENARFCYAVDAGAETCTATPSVTAVLSVDVADGMHTFSVVAVDDVGNRSATPRTWSWMSDTMRPVLAISGGPSEGSTVSSTTAAFTITTNEPATICWRLDAGPSTCSAWGATSFSATLVALPLGAHTLSVTAVDVATNESSTTRHWTIL